MRARSLPRLLLASLVGLLGWWGGPACVPPHGLGPIPLPGPQGGGTLSATLEYGFTPGHQVFQVDAAASIRIERWFSLEIGGLYTALRDPHLYPWQADDPHDFKHSGLPYVRPTFHLGPVTISVPLSAFFAIGPEAGAAWGYCGLSVAYATESWGVHAGASGHGVKYLTDHSEPTGGTWQVVLGGQYTFDWSGFTLGLSAEAIYGDQNYTTTGPSQMRSRSFFMALVGIELGWAYE